MKLQQLRFILAIAESNLNITQASQLLHTSQPGVSKQLRLLEDELGVIIFERNGKSLSGITKQGEIIIEKAKVIMQKINEIKTFSNELNPERRPLTIQSFSDAA